MRGWRLPIAASIAVHAAIAASMMLMPAPTPPRTTSKPVQIEIVSVPRTKEEIARAEVVPAERTEPVQPTERVEPVEPVEPAEPVERAERKRKRRREEPVPPAEPPSGGGGDGVEGGGGPDVGPTGPVAGDTGKTADGRDLSSLDLKPHVSVPRFEEQGSGVVVPEPKDPKRRPTKDGGWRYDDSTFGARVARDGTVTFDDRGHADVDAIPELEMTPGSETETPAVVGSWTIDVNDWILSAAGDDPYSYEKRKFLEATREERLAMARAACGERLSASLVDLPHRLVKIWRSKRPPDEKRRLLFDLWDDCAEDGSPEVKRYGALARLTILDFIQKHLPEGSAEAFTEPEIARLNERRASSRRFAPYGGAL